jgi:hypothetical protein
MTLQQLITTPTTGTLVELDCRQDSHEKVQLFWQPVTSQVFIRITTDSDIITRRVPNDEARQAYNQPWSYVD